MKKQPVRKKTVQTKENRSYKRNSVRTKKNMFGQDGQVNTMFGQIGHVQHVRTHWTRKAVRTNWTSTTCTEKKEKKTF